MGNSVVVTHYLGEAISVDEEGFFWTKIAGHTFREKVMDVVKAKMREVGVAIPALVPHTYSDGDLKTVYIIEVRDHATFRDTDYCQYTEYNGVYEYDQDVVDEMGDLRLREQQMHDHVDNYFHSLRKRVLHELKPMTVERFHELQMEETEKRVGNILPRQ